MTVSWSGPELGPVVVLQFLLQSNSLLDFIELDIDQRIIQVALRMNISQDLLGLFQFTFRDKPSRGFRDGPVQGSVIGYLAVK